MGWGKMILNNFWPKLFALILAMATWFYVFDLVNSDSFSQKETVEDVFSRYDFIVKEVLVKPVFSGRSPKGYRVALEKVKIEPSRISLFGPKDILDEVSELSTDSVDLSEYTRSAKLTLGLHSDVKLLNIEDKVVDVYLPVEIVQEDQ